MLVMLVSGKYCTLFLAGIFENCVSALTITVVFWYRIILPNRGSENSLLWPRSGLESVRSERSDFYLTFNQLYYIALTSLSPLVCIFIFTVYISTSDAHVIYTLRCWMTNPIVLAHKNAGSETKARNKHSIMCY
jgi:hypothetical protein